MLDKAQFLNEEMTGVYFFNKNFCNLRFSTKQTHCIVLQKIQIFIINSQAVLFYLLRKIIGSNKKKIEKNEEKNRRIEER